jgi:hypothetical protein
MANAKAGTFTLTTTSTSVSQSITGVGFTPKLVILWAQEFVTPTGQTQIEMRRCFGAASGTANQFVTADAISHSGGRDHEFFSDRCLCYNDATNDVPQINASFSSFGTDGFTLSVSKGAGQTINYLAIGGSDVSAKVLNVAAPTANGTQSVTGAGFAPSAVMAVSGPNAAAATITAVGPITFGFAANGSSAVSLSTNVDINGTSAAHTTVDSTRFIDSIDQSGSFFAKATISAWGSDGVTLNWDVAPSAAMAVGLICLGGTVKYDVSILTKPTTGSTPISQSKTGLTWQPVMLLLASRGEAASTSAATNMKYAVGAATDPTQRVAIGIYEQNASSATNLPCGVSSTTRALVIPGTSSGATLAEADLTSLDSGGYTLSWTKIDTIASEVIVLAMGAAVAAALASNVLGKSTVSAALTTQITLQASVLGKSTVTADLTAPGGQMVASILGKSTVTADLTTQPRLAANVLGKSTVTADMTTSIRPVATIYGRCTVTADLTIQPSGYRTDIKSKTTLTAALTTQILLQSAIACRSTITAALTTRLQIAAAVASRCTVTASLTAPSDLISALPLDIWLDTQSASRCILVEVMVSTGGSTVMRYLSNRNYTTSKWDTPANQAYEDVIVGGVKCNESLSLDGSVQMSFGAIGIKNSDGSFDSWLGDIWANQPVKVYMGDTSWPRSKFFKIFDGVVNDIGSQDRTTLSLNVRDKLQRLNFPISEVKLGGITADKDRLLPNLFGECHNITPLLVDPATHKYMVHNGPIEGIIEVRDNGIPLDPTEYTVDYANGTFSLLVTPAGTITCSAQGDKTGGVYVNTIASIIQRIAMFYGNATQRYALSDIDTANFTAFNTANPQPVGVYLSDTTNVLQTCQDLAKSVGAQICQTRAGLLTLKRIDFSFAEVGLFEINPEDMLAQNLAPAGRTTVIAADKVGFCKNWTVQSDLISGIMEEHKALFAEAYLTETVKLDAVAAAYGIDTEPTERDTYLLRRIDANAECNRRLAIESVPRTTYQFSGYPRSLLLTTGQGVHITHPRFGLSGTKKGVIVSLSPDWETGRTTVGVMV